MKTLIALILLVSLSIVRGQTISDVSDLSQIKVQTTDRGIVIAGDVRDVQANYPALAAALKTAIKARIDAADTMTAAKIWKELQARGVTLPAAATTSINSRIDTFRQQKETALLTVKNTDPARAKAKMDELIASGVAITQATQDAVNAAQPAPAPTATPTPTPNDGL